MEKPSDTPHSLHWEKLRDAAVVYINLSLALLAAFLIIRIIELLGISSNHDLPGDFSAAAAQSFYYDLVFFFRLLPCLFIPFIALYVRKSNCWGYAISGIVVLLSYILLVGYFMTSMVPLGEDLFGYSISEIEHSVSASADFNPMRLALLLIPPIVFLVALRRLRARMPLSPRPALALAGSGAILALLASPTPGHAAFSSDFSYNVALNKAAYFVSRSFEWFAGGEKPVAKAAQAFAYLDPEHPFLRNEETPDVLGGYFKINARRPPSIVIIAVEGLGRAFSGRDAYLESFTPFLDELADKSLYWENFLSSQGRTFASLPSILASLPFAESGFNDLPELPDHFSLLSILKRNGYRTAFYGGFDVTFDNQRAFLEKQGLDRIVGIDDFGPNYRMLPGIDWGYADEELLRKALADEAGSSSPSLIYIQTMSMHSPYVVPNQRFFIERFEERLDELGLSDDKKERRKKYAEIYSTIMYTDHALREFFGAYSKLPAYENTIFLITGDHRLPEIPMSTSIDRYHVPLIIFSPLLDRPARIRSISSHLDITPSLVAFFRENYGFETPRAVTWVGSGLDMEPAFRNVHSYPLKQVKNNLHNFISGLHFIDRGRILSVKKNLELEEIDDEETRLKLEGELERYKRMNQQMINDLRLVPKEVYDAFAG